MPLPPLETVTNQNVYITGDVTIHPSAAIAPGAILQATPNSRILIQEGACIGMGTILTAYQGTIEIESGAILGEGVLIVGQGKIGANACIGSATTIVNTSVTAKTVVSAHSLLGDRSRQIDLVSENPQDLGEPGSETLEDLIKTEAPSESKGDPEPVTAPEPEVETEVEPLESSVEAEPRNAPVVGQVYINQLLITLFPERKSEHFRRSG